MNSKIIQGYEKMVERVKTGTELWHLLLVVSGAVACTVLWMLFTFTTKAAGDDSHESIINDMTIVHKEINSSIKLLRLDAIKRDIRNNDSEMFQVQHWIKVGGEDPQKEKRLQILKLERAELELKRNCIISGNETCG